MSALDEKLERREASEGRARCLLNRHLTYRTGERLWTALSTDAQGPVRVRVTRRGKADEVWVRVARQDGDWLMELEGMAGVSEGSDG